MQRFTLAASALAILGAASAGATDLSYKDTTAATGNGYLPNGFYVSIGVGGGLTDTKASQGVDVADFNFAGLAFDGRIGYDRKFSGSNLLLGVFAGAGVDDIKGDIDPAHVGSQHFNWEVGARAGYVVGNTALIYTGVAFTQHNISISNTGDATALNGVEALGGVEVDLASLTGRNGLFVGSEAGYIWFGDWTPSAGAPTLSETELVWKGRLGLRF